MANKFFYRYIVIAFIALFILSSKVWSASETYKSAGIQASIRCGYVMPFQHAFREEYNQQLFIGNNSIPISIGIASQIICRKGFGIMVGCDMARFKALNGPINLSLIDATGGPTYTKHFGPGKKLSATASLGLGPSWALTMGEYQEALSAISYQTVKETVVYRSICTQMELDVQYNIKDCCAVGTYVAFCRKKYDPPSQGGLGVLSGTKIGLYFTLIK